MTIIQTLLARGYFPKELPPAFYTHDFAQFAVSKGGRTALSGYKPSDSFTDCAIYSLARPGGDDRRQLRIPHPAAFFRLGSLAAKHMSRLLKRAGSTKFSKSRPVYFPTGYRSIVPSSSPSDLARERACSRSGASYVLKADVSHFYPSLYTHAVGWAIDPKLRLKANWKNFKLLGKQFDQALMDADGKISQGIPIGNDISFLVAEIVLAQVDSRLSVAPERSYRWFDDYELSFDTRAEAESALKKLSRELGSFHLRLNPKKTAIVKLPQPAGEDWQANLLEAGKKVRFKPRQMVEYFDLAFSLRHRNPDSAVLSYALGMLFGIQSPTPIVGAVAQSCITQAVLSEPGAAQKAFALLSYWNLNGFALDYELIIRTINLMVMQHQHAGVSSDISWALAFAIDHRLSLGKNAARILSKSDDDCVAIQSLDMHAQGFLPVGFTTTAIEKVLKSTEFDREHWLLMYESARQGFVPPSAATLANPLFTALRGAGVPFYRKNLPRYAIVVHAGGAPDWMVQTWGNQVRAVQTAVTQPGVALPPIVASMARDASQLSEGARADSELVRDLLEVRHTEEQRSTGRETY